MGQDPRLDHVLYVMSHGQLADTVQRLGSCFCTRNFTLPLQNDQYIDV